MAENEGSGSGTGIVAIVAIFVLVVLGMLYVFRGRILGPGTSKTQVNVNIGSPSK
jgi:hypothetical protein